MLKNEVIGGVSFTISEEYERKTLKFLDVHMPWEEAVKLAAFILCAPAGPKDEIAVPVAEALSEAEVIEGEDKPKSKTKKK
jgi:hypothetical protein